MHCEHIPFTDYRYGKSLRSFEFVDFSYVELAKHRKKKAPKILFVLDYTPRESLRSGRLLKGPTGELLENIVKVAEEVYGAPSIDERDWLAVSYHSLKTQGGSDKFKEEAHREFKRRLDYIITVYKPEVVVTFGPDPYKALNNEFLSKYQGKDGVQYQHFYGVPIETSVTYKEETHKFKHVPTLSLHTLLNGDNKGGSLATIGYCARNMITALNRGELAYGMPKLDYTIEVVDDLKKFNAMYKDICSAKVVAIDTETKNLYKRQNQTLTWQFATNAKHAYILPFLHKDSPFMPEEIAYIKKKLRIYFERANKNKVQIYANAAFDLNGARRDLGVRYFKAPLWDVFAGEFAIDENMKFMQSVTGKNYYSLLNITMQYGCRAYYESEFGKEKRATIVDQDLEGPVLTYMALDVIVLHHIRKLQIKKAKDFNYDKYESVVSEQLSDLVHALSNLEYNGAHIDIDWLFKLKSQDSPIVAERAKVIKALAETKGVKKANQILIKKSGAPAVGLFGRVHMNLFNIRKEEHKQLLFFDVLKLSPIFLKKDGTGKIDKDFQEKYKDVEEVRLYNELTKLNKLYNAYVKSFIRQWGDDADMRGDSRIRPRFGYLDVVTGRTSAKKPSLQQIPSRSEMGKNIKRLFVAEKGRIIIKVDYCVAGHSLIPTENGLVRLDSLASVKDVPVAMSSLGAEVNKAVQWKYMGDKETLRVTTSSGNIVEVTPDHRIAMYDSRKGKWVEAQHCRVGDKILMPRQRVVRSSPLSLNLSDPVYVNANNKNGSTYNVYKSGAHTWRIKIKNGDVYYTESGFQSVDAAIAARDKFCAENGILNVNRSFRQVEKPKVMTPDLAFLLGALLADGHYTTHLKNNSVHFSGNNLDFVNAVADKFGTVFGVHPVPELKAKAGHTSIINGNVATLNNDLYVLRVRNNNIVKWMQELDLYEQHGLKDGKTRSRNLYVPKSILTADEESHLAFFAGFLEGDGNLKNGGVSYDFNSSSKKLVTDLIAMFNSHGYITSYNEMRRDHYTQAGDQVVIYTAGLGRGSSRDLYARMRKYVLTKHIVESESVDWLGSLDRRGDFLKDYFVTEITSIEDAGVQPVYDITMEDQTRPAFVANGLIVHNCAHEVRGWSIISGDIGVADAFRIGYDLRNEFKLKPNTALATEIEFKGDVHKINAAYFFRMPIETVDKPKRDSVKQVIFGLIYQQSAKGTAKSIKATVEEVEALTKKFFKRFPVGAGWFDKIKSVARRNLFVESPLGRRRNLWGLLVPKSHENHDPIFARNERQSVNSPVQGMGSDFMMTGARLIETLKYQHYEKTKHYPDFYQANSVHDSLEFSCAYEDFWLAVRIIEQGLTTEVGKVVKERHNFDFTIPLEIDFELGANLRDCDAWNYSLCNYGVEKDKGSLVALLNGTFEGIEELGHKVTREEFFSKIHSGFEHAPEWAKKQRANWIKDKGFDPLEIIDSKPKLKKKAKLKLAA